MRKKKSFIKKNCRLLLILAGVVALAGIILLASRTGKQDYYAPQPTELEENPGERPTESVPSPSETGPVEESTGEPTEESTEAPTEEVIISYELTELSRNFSSYGGEEDGDYIFVKENYHNLADKTMSLYALYDELMAQYPEYITRTQIATTAEPVLPVYGNERGTSLRADITKDSVFPVYRYDFCLSAAEGEQVAEKPKILYISGIHGGEYQQVFAAYRFFRMLCNEYEEEPLLGELHENVHFVVIPLANPFGFNFPSGRYNAEGRNVSKLNGRNVDISQNYPAETFSSGTDNMYGAAPLSEPESQAIYKIVQEEDFILSIDNHTFNFLAAEYSDAASGIVKHMGGYFVVKRDFSFWLHAADYLNGHIRELSPTIDETVLTRPNGEEYSYDGKMLIEIWNSAQDQMLCAQFRGIGANIEMVLSVDPENIGYTDGATPYMPKESQAFLVDQLAVIFYEAYIHLSE